jgi:vacuolar-type H+-ATPase subunit I/STV1
LIVSEFEKEISTQQDILEATKSANEKLIDKIQEQIS